MVEKYKMELQEILDELIEYRPSLLTVVGPTGLFNWRSVFDFSSYAWEEFDRESRTALLNGLAEKGSLFLALMTFKTMYMEMGRPDIAGAAGLSLARFLENLVSPAYGDTLNDSIMVVSDNYL